MIQENLNPEVRIEGILPTMLDTRTISMPRRRWRFSRRISAISSFTAASQGDQICRGPGVKGASVLKYDPDSDAANYCRELAKEVLANGSS